MMDTTIKLSLLAASAGGTTYAYMHWRDVSPTFKMLVHTVLVLTALAAIPEAISGFEKGLAYALPILRFALMRPAMTIFALCAAATALRAWWLLKNELKKPRCKCRLCTNASIRGFTLCLSATLVFALVAIGHIGK